MWKPLCMAWRSLYSALGYWVRKLKWTPPSVGCTGTGGQGKTEAPQACTGPLTSLLNPSFLLIPVLSPLLLTSNQGPRPVQSLRPVPSPSDSASLVPWPLPWSSPTSCFPSVMDMTSL